MKTFTFISTALILLACSSPVANKPKSGIPSIISEQSAIQPLEGLEIKPRIFQVSAEQASVVNLPNGGSISFPANSFVDEDGNVVTGQVQIEWTEYHSLTDIMASGIPMDYDSAGVKEHFISGGMFTIDGSQGGKDVEIAHGKEVDVKLATYDAQKSYNFYQLNENTGDWKYDFTASSVPNTAATVKKPAQNTAVKRDPKKEILAIDIVINPDSFPELKKETIVGWEWLPTGMEKEQKVLNGSKVRSKILSETNGNYRIRISSGKETAEIVARPVFLSEARQNTARVERETGNDVKSLLVFQKTNEQALAFREASIPGFGTYNWDMIHQRENPVAFAAHLSIPDKKDEPIAAIFHVCPEEKALVKYSKSDLVNFNYSPDKKNCMIIVYGDKTVYTVNNADFRSASTHKGEREFTFQPRKSSLRLNSPAQLGTLVEATI